MGAGLFKYGVGTGAGRNGRLVEEGYYIERLVLEKKQSSAWNWPSVEGTASQRPTRRNMMNVRDPAGQKVSD